MYETECVLTYVYYIVCTYVQLRMLQVCKYVTGIYVYWVVKYVTGIDCTLHYYIRLTS